MRGLLHVSKRLVILCGLPVLAHADQPPGFAEVYEHALEADTRLEASRLGVAASSEREREALGAWLPSVSANLGIDRARRDEREALLPGADPGARTFTRQQYQIRLEQPVYNRANWVQMRLTERETAISELEQTSEAQELITRVAEGYFDVLMAELETQLAEREIDALATQARRVDALYERQLASQAERMEVQAELEQARSDALRRQHGLEDAFERLREITGRRYTALRSLDDIAIEPPDPPELDHWIDRAMRSNPRLEAARQIHRVQRERIALERADHHPRIDLVASHTYFDDVDDEADLPIGTLGRRFNETVVGLQLTVPLYQGGRVSARARAAEQDARQTQQQVDGFQRQLLSEVRSSFRDVGRARSTVAALERAVEAEDARIQAIEEELRIGRRSVVDLLDARRERFESRLALAQSRLDYLNARLALRRAAGALDQDAVTWVDGLLEG